VIEDRQIYVKRNIYTVKILSVIEDRKIYVKRNISIVILDMDLVAIDAIVMTMVGIL